MPIIKFYIISCMGGIDHPEPFFIWGEFAPYNTVPDTRKEAEKRIKLCQEKTGCPCCDAEIHHINLDRSRPAGIQYIEEYSRKIGKPKKTS